MASYDVASMIWRALGTVVTVAAAGLLAVPLSDTAARLGMTVDDGGGRPASTVGPGMLPATSSTRILSPRSLSDSLNDIL